MNWQEFEDDCYNYLNKNKIIKDHDIKSTQRGKSNSRESDILVEDLCCANKFYIECKMANSQTSQFVVELIDNKFIFSENNLSEYNDNSTKIINSLNNNIETYKNVSTKDIEITLNLKDISKYLINSMKEKNIKYIITGNSKIKYLFPIEEIDKYFKMKVILRRKKSGSSNLSKEDINNFNNNIFNNKSIIEILDNKNKRKSYITKNTYNLYKNKFDLNKYFFRFIRDEDKYKITKKSNTNNINVIFKLTLDKKYLT